MSLRENLSRSKSAIALLKLTIALSVVMFAGKLYGIYTVNSVNMAVWDSSSTIYLLMIIGIMAFLAAVLNIITIVYFIRWFRRAYFNLHLIFKDGLRYSEGWAAGAWFIPIFNWFGPYQIAKEMNEKTSDVLKENNLNVEPKQTKTTTLWWALWITSSILSSISSQLEKSLNGDLYTFGVVASAIAILISIGAGIMCIKYIQGYSAMETELTKVKNLGTPNFVDGNSDLLDSSF